MKLDMQDYVFELIKNKWVFIVKMFKLSGNC